MFIEGFLQTVIKETKKVFYHEGHEGNEGLKDETFQAVFQDFHIEIDQKALFYFGKSHICQQLSFMKKR
jgi:hypothetical protein